MISTTCRARLVTPYCLFFLFVALLTVIANGSEWLGGDADWFDQNNWDAGVSNMSNLALVNSGVARFDHPATAQGLVVGGRSSTSGVFQTRGEINGTATLTVFSNGYIGTSSGTGTGTEREGVGRLILNGGDLVSKSVFDPIFMIEIGGFQIAQVSGTGTNTQFAAEGDVQITNGSLLSEGGVTVGNAGGTGTGGTRTSHGSLSIMGGDLRALANISVGSSGGTGSTDGFAYGVATITDGDVIVTPYSPIGDDPRSSLSVGTAGGNADFDGTANGELLVERGDIEAWTLRVGFAGGTSRSTSRAHGRLTLRSGDLRMQEMAVGVIQENGVEVSGLFHLADGVAYGDSLEVGPDGTVVLEIGAGSPAPTLFDSPSFAASLPDPTPYGRLLVDQVALNGVLEARFTTGFTPQPGDTYDLITADSLTGNYDLLVTGLSPQAAALLEITQTPTLLQLRFIVPEPTTLMLLAMLTPALVGRRRPPVRSAHSGGW